AVFAARGTPRMVIMLSGGFASTVGLAAAARQRQIPVVEVQHGAESEATVLAAHAARHFSSYNCTPTAFVSWELEPRNDPQVIAMGPIGLHLSAALSTPSAGEGANRATFRRFLAQQRQLLGDIVSSRRVGR